MAKLETIDANLEALRAVEAGRRIAERALKLRRGGQATGGGQSLAITGGDLGRLVASPAAFWAAACAVKAGDPDAVEAMAAGVRMTAAQLSAGDFGQVREALIGQSAWLGMLAVDLVASADDCRRGNGEEAERLLRLALAAQRQAAQTLASAAALSRLEAAGSVTVE